MNLEVKGTRGRSPAGGSCPPPPGLLYCGFQKGYFYEGYFSHFISSLFLSPLSSIHNGVIAVFQRKGLPDQELFGLNEGVR